MTYIVIDNHSDCAPVIFPTDTDAEIAAARVALRNAGLDYEDVWTSPGDEWHPDSYKTGQKIFAL